MLFEANFNFVSFAFYYLVRNLKPIVDFLNFFPKILKPKFWTATVIPCSSYTTILEKKRRVMSMRRLPCYCMLLTFAGKLGTIAS